MAEDPELLRIYVQEKSESAFAEIVQRHLRFVYSVSLRRVGNDAHLAEEVTQDVFIALSRKASALASNPSLTGWLFISARFASSKIVRRERRKRALTLNENVVGGATSPVEAEPDWSEMRPLLDALIQKLNTADRDALLLRFYENRTFAQIAETLRLSENGARMRVSRGLEKLRAKLNQKGIASTAIALAAGLSDQACAAVPSSLAANVVSSAVSSTAIPGSLLSIMALTKTQTAALTVLIAGGMCVGIQQHRELKSARAAFAAQSATLEDVRKQLRETFLLLKQTERTEQNVAASPSVQSTAVSPAASDSGSSVTVVHIRDVVRDHPEFAALARRQQREGILAQYRDAIHALNLLPNQENKLKDLLIDKDNAGSDAAEAAVDAGVVRNSKEMGKAVAAATAQLDEQIKAVIGAAAYDKLETLRGSMGFSITPSTIVSINLLDAQKPLTTEESARIQEAYYEVNSAALTPESKDPAYKNVDPKSWLSKADENFLNKAAGILTPDQIEITRTALADHNHYNNILDKYNQNKQAMMIVP